MEGIDHVIYRSFDTEFITSVIEHPSVIGGAKALGGIDLAPIVDDMNNFILVNDHGGFVVIKVTDGTYECHTQFLPEGRGAGVRDAVTDAFDYMFINTDCTRIITKAYKDNPASVALSGEFFTVKGETDDYHYYEKTYADWVFTSDSNLIAGADFHTLVEDDTNHEDDAAHDYHVGASLRMAKAGNLTKAENCYNAWASMSGYEPLRIIRSCPPLATIGNITLEIINGEV